jgi:hypothetical protein
MNNVQFSKDIAYNLLNFTQKGTIANENAAGCLSEIPKRIINKAVKVKYFCSQSDFDAICEALNHRLVIPDFDGSETTHPALKFLSEYLIKSVLNMDFKSKVVKVIGAKLTKEEAHLKSKGTHFCFLSPNEEDHYRAIESKNVNKRDLFELDAKINVNEVYMKTLRDGVQKNPVSNYGKGLKEQMIQLEIENSMLRDEKHELESLNETLNTTSSKIFNNCCNVGAELCSSKADVVVGFDSFYDVDLKDAFKNFSKCGVSEVYISLILPFGLLFVDEYYSKELRVTFKKTNFLKRSGIGGERNGFVMIHDDLSNGYIHETSTTVFDLMGSSFIEPKDSEPWMGEIVSSIAEICLIKFTKSKQIKKTVRKLLPPKFDKYSVIYDPIEYFGPLRKRIPIMVETKKLEGAIASVARSKNNKTIIQDTYAFVQASFMTVSVGGTTLQEGADLSNKTISSMVLYAIIEGGFSTAIIGDRMNQSRRRSIVSSIFNALKAKIKENIHDLCPSIYNFFTKSRVEKYLNERIDLREQVLYSDINRNCFKKFLKYLNNMHEEACENYDNLIPTLSDIIEQGLDPITYFAHIGDVMWNGDNLKLNIFRSEKYKKKIERAKEAERFENKGEDITTNQVYNKYHQLTNINKNKEYYEELEAIANIRKYLGTYDDEDTEDPIKEIMSTKDSNYENSKSNTCKYLEGRNHDRSRNLFDLVNHMDDLSTAAMTYNLSRVDKNGTIIKLADKEIEKMVKNLSLPGAEFKLELNLDEVKKDLESLISSNIIDQIKLPDGTLLRLSKNIVDKAKSIVQNEEYKNINNRKVYFRNGVSGCGKTKYVTDNWDDRSAYVVPYAAVCLETDRKIKEKYGNSKKYPVKTYQKFTEIPKEGSVCYIDEAGSMLKPFTELIIASTNYDKYIIMGDEEQTAANDNSGIIESVNFVELATVHQDKVERIFYTFRFGPTLASFMNYCYNYPVFSLKNKDTKVNYYDLSNVTENMEGLNITVSTAYRDELNDKNVGTILTSKSSQGLSKPIVNLIYTNKEANDSMTFRSTGIVAATRAEDELNLYIDLQSKASGAVAVLKSFLNNFETNFGFTLANNSDF